MAKELKAPELMNYAMFCGGCGHGVLLRLICECLEEYGLDKKTIAAIGVGCSCHLKSGINVDLVQSPHGRAAAVATGIRRAEPDKFVFSYQGDGDAYNIGLAETLNAAYRNENICVFTINNGNFGMTGGQMAWTTMPGQKTATSPKGRDCAMTGIPIKVPELIAYSFTPAYVARGAVTRPRSTGSRAISKTPSRPSSTARATPWSRSCAPARQTGISTPSTRNSASRMK